MEQKILLSDLATDTINGLSANPKYLLSKYLYDDIGSGIFQDIMQMSEYYLTDCEHEIFSFQKERIMTEFIKDNSGFELIELGSGDGLKTKVLLNSLVNSAARFQYIPIDISIKANNELVNSLAKEFPSLKVNAQTGDFFRIMKRLNGFSGLQKVILFLGSNIGNFTNERMNIFLNQLSEFTGKGDKVMIGFDLKKSPEIIVKAYNDPHGFSRDFTLNHLTRLNRELNADFNLNNFEHHTTYNPQTGALKSFLVSKKDQLVNVESLQKCFHFNKWEAIFMELSQKFDLETIGTLASSHGFRVENHFTDSRNYFADSLWVKVR